MARFTLPSAKVLKTSNKTAGHTPYHHSSLVKRHLSYGGNKCNGTHVRVVRKVQGGNVVSTSHLMGRNMEYYLILPDFFFQQNDLLLPPRLP